MNQTWHDNLPNLIIAGVRKGGTTSLSNYLAQHPDICSSKLKKVGYFLPAKYDEPLDSLESYAQHFAHANGERYRMEAAPGYFLGSDVVPTLMAESLHEARVVISLREPVDSLWSYYRWVRSHNRIPAQMTFEKYVDVSRQMMVSGEDLDREANAYLGYRGVHYAEPLQHWVEAFGERLLVVDFAQLGRDPLGTVIGVCQWLGIDTETADSFDYDIHNKSVQVRSSRLQTVALEVNRRAKAQFRRHRALKRRIREAYYLINGDQKGEPTMSSSVRSQLHEELTEPNARLALILRNHGGGQVPDWLAEFETGRS